MKINCLYAGALLLLLASCSGHKATEATTQDSALTGEAESPVAGPTDFTLTADSIGPVHVDEQISRLPPAVPNLYDYVLPTETPDAMAYTYLLEDVPQFTVYDFMEGKVNVIALEGNARGVATPDGGTIRVGDDFSRVFALPGVESEWESLEESGVWYWKWRGLYFGVDEMNLNEKVGAALCDGRHAPRASDFTPGIKIGYIGTGLPF